MTRLTVLLLGTALLAPMTAHAQRTTNNAVTASDDAFGRSVGSERIGIYSNEDVRGFNPVEAGNVRIDGLYFDQQSLPSSRLVESSSIRVGYAARGYPFPAPTGIADLQSEKFEGQRVFSMDVDHEDRQNVSGSVQVKLPLAVDRLGIAAGFGARIARIPQGRNGNFRSGAIAINWKPYDGASIDSFFSAFRASKLRVQPTIFAAGTVAPPRVSRKVDYGQPWARSLSTGQTLGVVAKLPMGAMKLEAGLFRSVKEDPRTFAELLLGTLASGSVANRVIIADEDNFTESTSGEVRLSRIWQSATLRHTVMATAKGRDQSRTYGGQQRVSLGASQVESTAFVAPRTFTFGPDDASKVQQITFGLGYDLQWRARGSLGLAIQKSDYKKDTRFANPALPLLETRDKPWLFSANGTVNILPSVLAYGGYVRGLEESPVAPDVASNRNEAPPAVRTSQKDAGLRVAVTPKLTLITGVFSLRKPYFNLDSASRFRQLGSVTNSGAEFSLAGSLAPGLTVVAGTLLLYPKIDGAPAGIGDRPVGSFKRHSIANLDWKPAGQAAWSFDIAFDSYSSQTGNTANTLSTSARETIGLGSRYRFKLGAAKMLLRAQVTNLFNAYDWRVSSSGGFTYVLPRTFSLNLAADI